MQLNLKISVLGLPPDPKGNHKQFLVSWRGLACQQDIPLVPDGHKFAHSLLVDKWIVCTPRIA